MRRKLQVASIVASIVLLVGCIHKSGGKVTPWERVHTYNAAFADANQALTQGVIAVQTSGLITVNQAKPILDWTNNVAVVHKQITAILAKGSVTAADITTIRALLDQLKTSANAIVNSGAAGIKNPKSQQAISADINSIASLGDAVLAALSAIPTGGTQ